AQMFIDSGLVTGIRKNAESADVSSRSQQLADFQSPRNADISSPSHILNSLILKSPFHGERIAPIAFEANIQASKEILGKRPAPPSPSSSTRSSVTPAPREVDSHMADPASAPSPVRAPVPSVDWEQYFGNLENAISGLKATHLQTPRYL